MSTRTIPGNPDASDGAGGERRRGIAAIAGGAALVAFALAATACMAAPSGSSSQVSLNGASRPAALVTSSSAAPGIPVTATSSAAKPGVPVASSAAASMAPGSPARGGTPSRPVTAPATSARPSAPRGSATSPAWSASSAPGTGSAPPSSAPPSSAPPSYAPSTEPAPSEPAGGGLLSVSEDCGIQTISAGDPYSCTVTASGGIPPYTWTLYNEGVPLAGSLPPGLSTTSHGSTFTIFGQPDPGSFTFTVQVKDQESGIPVVNALTTFALTVK